MKKTWMIVWIGVDLLDEDSETEKSGHSDKLGVLVQRTASKR